MNDWIKGSAAAQYLTANYPFENGRDAALFLDRKLADGDLRWQRDPRILPKNWDEMRAEEGCPEYVSFNCVEVRRADIQKICPLLPKHPGGRSTKHNYEGALIHLANLCLNEASFCSPSEDDLFQAMRDWFNNNDPGGGPDNREIRKRVEKFHREVFSEE